MKTYNDLFLESRKRLKNEGIDAYSLEARLIVCAAAEKTKEEYTRDMRLYAPDETEEAVEAMMQRRISGEPVAYITEEWEFYGIPLNITTDVLIPRIDTEILVDCAIDELKSRATGTRALDLCCGSGCIGMAVISNVTGCRMVFADNSPKALRICRSNLMRNNLTRLSSCIEADATGLPPMLIGTFDIIMCNPPYIPTADLVELDPSVRDYEPVTALDGGEDGLDFYRWIIPEWRSVLKDGGCMMFECGIGQAKTVADILDKCGFEKIEIYKDTQGIERVVKGIKITEDN